MSGSYRFRDENQWENFHKLHLPDDVHFINKPNSWYSQSNGSRKDPMAYGGMAYYDNATYGGPHSKGSFSRGSSDHPDYTYRRGKNRCCIAIIILVLLLVVGIGVFLGVYFGVMDKPDKITDQPQYEKGKFQTSLKINQNWDPKYADQNSPEYQNLKTNLDNQLTSMYQGSSLKNDFQRVDITGVSAGSIVVVYIVIMVETTQYTPTTVQTVTKDRIQQIKNDAQSTSNLLKDVDINEISVSSVPLTTTLVPPTTTTTSTTTVTTTKTATTTEAVTTPPKTTEAMMTELQTTEAVATPPQTTEAMITQPQTTEAVATPPQTTEAMITQPQTTEAVATPPQTTEAMITQPQTTEAVVTTPLTTEAMMTQPQTTEAVATPPQTTEAMITQPLTTETVATQPKATAKATTESQAILTSTDEAVTQPEATTEGLPEATTTPNPPPITTDNAMVTTQPLEETTTVRAQTQPPVTTPDVTTDPTFLDGNPCTNHSLLVSFSYSCIQKSVSDLMTQTTDDGKCNVLLENVLPCILSEIKTKYGKTCTKKQQHNIIIENKDDIKAMTQIDPQSCLPSPSCSMIEAVVYYVPIICEEQTDKLLQSGSCSDFSDALKCYYYHVGSSCNSTDLYNTISNSYTEWNAVIGQPPQNTCSVSINWIDSTAKTSLCSDPDATDIMVNMYCPNDLREFVMAGTNDKCMKANNLVVCIEQQMKAVLKTTCTINDIYNVMDMYQSNITGVSDQPSIIDCHTEEYTTDEMTTTEAATTTATIVNVEGEFEANMKVNQTWDPKFEEKNSTEYKDLTENFRNQTLALYNYKNSSVQVEDIIVLDVSQGSLIFDFIIILVKTLPDIAEWTAEKLIEKTVEIIETIQNDPEVVLDLIQTVDTKKIEVIQKVEILTECDRVGYIKPIVQHKCKNAMLRLFQVPDNQTRCDIFLQVVGCVVFHAQQCSVFKVTRTISRHFNAMKPSEVSAGKFDPSICYASEENLVLPTIMPVTAQVKPCVHPDVLSYILNFDCHYDAIPMVTKDNASMAEQCRFYWMAAVCVYQTAQENQLLQRYGQCTYEETRQVFVNYASRIFKVRPQATASQCYAYNFDKEDCSMYMYDPKMYKRFEMCSNELFELKDGMKDKFDLTNMTCRLYKEAVQCMYRHYRAMENSSCDWMEFGKNAAWMINSWNAQLSQFMDKDYNEPNVVNKCIDEATSDTDFGQSICVDGEALILSTTECISDTLLKADGGICQSFKNHYLPCVKSRIPAGINCDLDEIESSIMMETDLMERLTRRKVFLSQCTGEGDKSSNRFNITMKLMMDWDPNYADESSAERQNLTSEFLRQINIAMADFISMVEYVKIVDIRPGSVILVLELKYAVNIATSNILSETQKLVSDAKTDQNPTLMLLSIVDENSIEVKAFDDDSVSDDFCGSYRGDIMNMTHCGMAIYGFVNRTDIDQAVLCGAYKVYLSCLKISVERMGKDCKISSLKSWIPFTLQFYLTQQTADQVNQCTVDDKYEADCNDTSMLETMALNSGCARYIPLLNYQDCNMAWKPYLMCVAYMFPTCPEKKVAEKLLSSTRVSGFIPQGFNVMDMCFQDAPVLEASTLFSITLELMMDWDPNYADKSSPQYQNLTSELIREMNLASAAANYTDLIDYMKITEVRQGSVVVVFEVRYNFVIKTSDIMTGTQQIVMGATMDPNTPLKYLKTVNMGSISVKALQDSTEMDYCTEYKGELVNNTQCGNAMYGFMNRTSIPQQELCGAYNVYLMCIRGMVERMGKKCDLSSLHRWMPHTFPYYLTSVSVDQVNMCALDNDHRTDCDDTKLFEVMALRSSCAGYVPFLYLGNCSTIWRPYLKCVADLFPSCQLRDVAEKLVTRTNVSQLIPPGLDVMDRCFPDGSVLEQSSLFNITVKLMIDWDPNYSDMDSPEYKNLAGELVREMYIAVGNMTSYIQYIKIASLRQGSVYVVYQIKYLMVLKRDDVISGARNIINMVKMDPKTPLDYLNTADVDSISVIALPVVDPGTSYCSVYREDIMNNTRCGMAIYGFMNRTHVGQQELCFAYDIYLTCLKDTVEKMGKDCNVQALHRWMSVIVTSMIPSVSSSDINMCELDEKDTDCDSLDRVERMAFQSSCSGYIQFLQSPICNIWLPYFGCVAGMFPTCDGKDIANNLITNSNVSKLVPPGFDVMGTCYQDRSSTKYRISMKFDISWIPGYADKNSEEYRNLTQEIMNQMRMATVNYTDTISTMEIVELRPGSVIVVFEVNYVIAISESDIRKTSAEIVMAAKMQPHLYLLRTVDPKSIDVEVIEADKSSSYDCTQYHVDIVNINPACGVSMSHLFNRTNIRSDEICRTYDVALTCIHQTVEMKTKQECRKTNLHTWMPYVVQGALPNLQASQVAVCPVTNDPFHCNDTQLFVSYAFGACYQTLSQYLPIAACGEVWVPYINCTAGLFPRCPIKTVAESLMTSPNFTSLIPEGFDVIDSCFPERVLPAYMVSLRFEMPWQPDFADEDSEEYKNLTTEVLRQMMIATASYNDTIKNIKIYEVRQGSVIIVLEVQLFEVSSEEEVKAFVTNLVLSVRNDSNPELHMLRKIDPYRIEIDEVPDWLRDDVCETYRTEIITVSASTCGFVLFGFGNKTEIDMDSFCTAYNVYLTCIQDKEEEKWKRDCKKSSLDQWIPAMLKLYLPNISVDKYRMCNVTQDIDVCTDEKSVAVATVNSFCAFSFMFLHWTPNCNATIGAFDCVKNILPSCKPEQIIRIMMNSPNMTALLPTNLDPMSCFGDVCRNYTELVEKDQFCKSAFSGDMDMSLPHNVQCRRYNLYAGCLQNNIRKQGRECEKDSLHGWLPQYLDMKHNITGVENCSFTHGSLCRDLATIETVVLYTNCTYYHHLLRTYPSCLNSQVLIKCMAGTLNDCNNYTLANMLMMSNHSLMPTNLDVNHCLKVDGTHKFQVNFTINMTWNDNLNHWNSTQYKELSETLKVQVMDLFTYDQLFLYKQIEEVDVFSFSQGSVIAHTIIMIESESPFYKTLTAMDLKQELIRAIEWLQSNPPSKSNYFMSVNPQNVFVMEIRDPVPSTTTVRPYITTPITPSCGNPAYLKMIIENFCESSKNQLLRVDKNQTCRVLYDMVGCTMFNTRFMCSEEEVMTMITRHSNDILEFVFDTSQCHVPGSDVVLPTIVPKNTTLSPCSYPDVLHYILNYDCYYYGMMDHVQGTSQMDSCRFYWYSTSCVYQSMNASNNIPNCPVKQVMDTFTKYEDDLFEVSPANVDLKYCMDNGNGTCARMVYGPNSYQIALTCYGNTMSNRMLAQFGYLNLTGDLYCLVYEEMFECMYRAYRNSCSKAEMEREAIWFANALNSIMTITMGQNYEEEEVVSRCLGNSSNKADFGQDICYDGPGLIMSNMNCVYDFRDCNSFQYSYIPCVVSSLAMNHIRCDRNVLFSSLLKESALLKRLLPYIGDISSCGKAGMCPPVANVSGSHWNGTSCERLCTDDLSCQTDLKCCYNGCGFSCMVPEIMTTRMPNINTTTSVSRSGSSNRMNVSVTFDIPWKAEFGSNETYKADILQEVNLMVNNSGNGNYVKSIEITKIKPGSTIVFLEVNLWDEYQASEIKQLLDMMILGVQWQPMYPWLQKVKHVTVNSLPTWTTNSSITRPTPTGMSTTIEGKIIPTPPPTTSLDQLMCKGSWGNCLSETNCHLVTWSYNYSIQTIVFNVTAAVEQDKWIGIGFNDQQKMSGADAIIGWVTPDGDVVVTDRKNTGYWNTLDTKQNIHNIQGYRFGGITSISFSRNRTTPDITNDFTFNATSGAYFIYPLGGTYSDDKSITKHGNTPAISADKFSFPCTDVCTNKDFFRMWAPKMCSSEVSSFKETDDTATFCSKLGLVQDCVKRNLPQYGCSGEVQDSTFMTLLTLLNELVPFDITAKVSFC